MPLCRDVPVLDNASRTFATTFYDCLINYGYSVKKSFDIALSDIRKIFPQEKDKFLLLPKDNDDDDEGNIGGGGGGGGGMNKKSSIHDVCIDIPKQRGTMINKSPHYPVGNHKSHDANMIGRQEYAIQIYRHLHQSPNKLITVTGTPKIGKTEVIPYIIFE
jgi:hypothetical protein